MHLGLDGKLQVQPFRGAHHFRGWPLVGERYSWCNLRKPFAQFRWGNEARFTLGCAGPNRSWPTCTLGIAISETFRTLLTHGVQLWRKVTLFD